MSNPLTGAEQPLESPARRFLVQSTPLFTLIAVMFLLAFPNQLMYRLATTARART